MFDSLKTAINGLLRSRKFWIWLVACVGTGVMSVIDGTPEAKQLFLNTFREGAALLGTLFTVEDIASKANKTTVIEVKEENPSHLQTTEITPKATER